MGTVSMNINMNSVSELHKSRTTFQINQNQQMDSYSKSLQEQINNAKEQLQSLGEDKEMSIDEKMKKRQEIQKAMHKGFGLAGKSWGRKLPSICQQTMDAADSLFDNYFKAQESESKEVISEATVKG